MERVIKDKDYIECLPVLYRKHYSLWRGRMLKIIDEVAATLEHKTPEEVMEQFSLTKRDIAILVRLEYFTPDETERFGLRRIEETVRA